MMSMKASETVHEAVSEQRNVHHTEPTVLGNPLASTICFCDYMFGLRMYYCCLAQFCFNWSVMSPVMCCGDESSFRQVYRYFAYDCAGTFPGIPEGPPKKHTDIICTRAYSDVAPSTGGELVYKVISPHIITENPYADEIANLLKITNLRFNFTKLHTLGDDLLDYRPEIEEKYYYAIYDMVVRGSCSCYGHASRCIPIENNNDPALARDDIVHGRCECMHNTEGLNCERCRDFYNDLPWRPAIGEDTNECRRCECNGHAARCHFDRAVYQASGFQSGGVCDDCQHNTQGKNCEQCKPFFYRDPARTITDVHVCLPCNCDKAGSQNDGICEGEEDSERGLVAGKCYCKPNIDGPRCDRCKNGFWNLEASNPDGCIPCTCHLLGTYNNEGCDKRTGHCTCKRLVTGDNCDQCLPEHYGLSEEADGCKACDCDIGGAVDNSCDLATGQCKCRQGFSGRRCDTADSSFYCANIDNYLYEAENTNLTYADVELRELPSTGHDRTWTGEGFARVNERSLLSFSVNNLKISQPYNVILRYDTGRVVLLLAITLGVDMRKFDLLYASRLESTTKLGFNSGRREQVHPIGKRFELKLLFNTSVNGNNCRAAWVLIDSLVLAPPTEELDIFKGSGRNQMHRTEYERYQCRNLALSLAPRDIISDVWIINGNLLNMSTWKFYLYRLVNAICVQWQRCDQCAVGTYGFGPSGCNECACDSVGSLHNRCDKQSGQCLCREKGIYGRQCNQCQPGFWSFPDCRILNFSTGYSGERCGDCAVNYWGNPTEVGGSCERCDCNGNIDMTVEGSCDASTGECLKCLHNTEGIICENCVDGFYGDAKIRSCQRCVCNNLGTNFTSGSCDRISGQCPCFMNVIGMQCDQCAENHYDLSSGKGCAACDCDPNGVVSKADDTPDLQCNEFDGRCRCKMGRGGRTCSECQDYFWGDPTSSDGCKRCECNPTGSASQQCHRNNGTCTCLPGSGGDFCNECARGYTGTWPHCQPCGECFHQWDGIIQGLKNQVEILINSANNIEDTGVASAYDEEFEKMETVLDETKKKLSDANISKEHIDQLDNQVSKLKKEVTNAREHLDLIEARVSNATQAVDFAQEDLKQLQTDADKLTAIANDLNDKANKIKEADGAYNITKESASKSIVAQRRTDAAIGKLAEAESEAREAEALLEKNREDFDKQYAENEAALAESEQRLHMLEAALPLLNAEVCGATSAPCDALCGGYYLRIYLFFRVISHIKFLGPGSCGFCGGQSCLDGAVSKAEQARSFALEADLKLNEKQKEAEEVLTLVRDVLHSTAAAKKDAEVALAIARAAAHRANVSRSELDQIVEQMNDFLKSSRSSPEEIRNLAEEVLSKKISLTPEQISDLTAKSKALAASKRAAAIKNTVDTVREALRVAEEAQLSASDAIKIAEETIKMAKEDLDATKIETEATESRAKEANFSLTQMEGEMKKVKVQYLQIADDAKNAFQLVDKALQASGTAEQGNKQMTNDIETANKLLTERTEGNEATQKRAEFLRQRASKLLYKAQRHNDDIKLLTKDASDVKLDDYQRSLDEIYSRLEQVTNDIHTRAEYFATCDV
uniref:Laminin EGF-like domain-containing protein n=1 Tax=Heterorhabditis bacteriophora TaxID=37862 RepID=A0A1I7WMT3_HETBA